LVSEAKDDNRRPYLRELQDRELTLMRVVVAEPTWLAPHDEAALRWALSFARVSSVPVRENGAAASYVEVGHATDGYRKKLKELLDPCFASGADKPKREAVRAQLPHIRELARDERREVLRLFGDRLPEKDLDRAVRRRPLALALGGGGGTCYVFVGAMALLDEAGLEPELVAGTSMGSILGAFRCRQKEFSIPDVKALLSRLSWRKVFKLFETSSRFGLPATLKLHLREVIGHEFEQDGQFQTLKDLEIPLRVCVAGLSGGETQEDPERYAHLLDDAVVDIRRFRSRAAGIARALSDITRQPVKGIYLGGDELTEDFDVLDAMGFSSAVPGVIHYDILRDDPRMIDKVAALVQREGVLRLVDGGLADNLPAREAWRAVQSGAIVDRDPFVLAMDGFAPRLSTRHLLFLPLMRLAAENSKAGREAAHLTLAFKHVLSPLSVVPTQDEFVRAIELGKREAEPIIPLVRKMVGPIPDPPGILSEMDGTGDAG
jgi:predicted acylesterase/phospholipase RssA